MAITTWPRRSNHLDKDLTHADGNRGLVSAGGAIEEDGGLEPKLVAHLV